MKIVICASMSAVGEIIRIQAELQALGHLVVTPENLDRHLAKTFSGTESTAEKIKDDLIKKYFEKIKNSDAVLVLNFEKNGVANYIGGNTFLEMGFAHVLEKKIFLFNEIPEISYRDEIIAMQPIILNGDLGKIV